MFEETSDVEQENRNVGNRAVSVFARRMAGGLNVKDAVYYELKAPVGMNIPSFPHSTKLTKPPAPHRRHAMLQQTHLKPRMHRLYTEAMGQCHHADSIARDYATKPDERRARPTWLSILGDKDTLRPYCKRVDELRAGPV
jgi:hypothetical protein